MLTLADDNYHKECADTVRIRIVSSESASVSDARHCEILNISQPDDNPMTEQGMIAGTQLRMASTSKCQTCWKRFTIGSFGTDARRCGAGAINGMP